MSTAADHDSYDEEDWFEVDDDVIVGGSQAPGRYAEYDPYYDGYLCSHDGDCGCDQPPDPMSDPGLADLLEGPATDAMYGLGMIRDVPAAQVPPAVMVQAVLGAQRLISWARAQQHRWTAALARPDVAVPVADVLDSVAHRNQEPGSATDIPEDLADRAAAGTEVIGDDIWDALLAAEAASAAEPELSAAWQVAPITARRRIADAQELVDELPDTFQALEEGRIEEIRARIIAETTVVLDPQLRRRAEQLILDRAKRGLCPGDLRRLATKIVADIDPDAAAKRAEQARARRGTGVRNLGDDLGRFTADLAAEDAALTQAVLDLLAKAIPPEARHGRGLSKLRADIFADLFGELADTGLIDLRGINPDINPDPADTGPADPDDGTNPNVEPDPTRPADTNHDTAAADTDAAEDKVDQDADTDAPADAHETGTDADAAGSSPADPDESDTDASNADTASPGDARGADTDTSDADTASAADPRGAGTDASDAAVPGEADIAGTAADVAPDADTGMASPGPAESSPAHADAEQQTAADADADAEPRLADLSDPAAGRDSDGAEPAQPATPDGDPGTCTNRPDAGEAQAPDPDHNAEPEPAHSDPTQAADPTAQTSPAQTSPAETGSESGADLVADPTGPPDPTGPTGPTAAELLARLRSIDWETRLDPDCERRGGLLSMIRLPAGVRVNLDVTVALSTLAGCDDLSARLAGLGVITADTARALAKAAGTVRILLTNDPPRPPGNPPPHGSPPANGSPPSRSTDDGTNPEPDNPAPARWNNGGIHHHSPDCGTVLDYGRTAYRPPASVIDRVDTRDQRCRFPGCPMSAERCDHDHRITWDDGGATCPCDLDALCRFHHRAKTFTAWSATRDQRANTMTWTSPLGRVHVDRPAPDLPTGTPINLADRNVGPIDAGPLPEVTDTTDTDVENRESGTDRDPDDPPF